MEASWLARQRRGGDGPLEFEVFRARKRISEHCKHLEPVFGGKRANLEAQAAQKTQDTNFSEFAVYAVLSRFGTKNPK